MERGRAEGAGDVALLNPGRDRVSVEDAVDCDGRGFGDSDGGQWVFEGNESAVFEFLGDADASIESRGEELVFVEVEECLLREAHLTRKRPFFPINYR